MQKITEVQMAESNFQIVIQTYLAEAFISRVSPALHEEFYFERLAHLLNLIPNSKDHKNIEYLQPLSEFILTFMFREDIKHIKDETVYYISPFEVISRVLTAINDHLLQLDDQEIQKL